MYFASYFLSGVCENYPITSYSRFVPLLLIVFQEFVSGHEECQELLVSQVVELGSHLGGLLAPHFTPAATPTHKFLTLYASLASHAPQAPDHIFMLLSKVCECVCVRTCLCIPETKLMMIIWLYSSLYSCLYLSCM